LRGTTSPETSGTVPPLGIQSVVWVVDLVSPEVDACSLPLGIQSVVWVVDLVSPEVDACSLPLGIQSVVWVVDLVSPFPPPRNSVRCVGREPSFTGGRCIHLWEDGTQSATLIARLRLRSRLHGFAPLKVPCSY